MCWVKVKIDEINLPEKENKILFLFGKSFQIIIQFINLNLVSLQPEGHLLYAYCYCHK
jgi:hypothetical protein